MPGLVRGVARTAVIAGTATAVSNRVSRRQATRWSQQAAEAEPAPQQVVEAAPPPPPPPAAAPATAAGGMTTQDRIAALQQLADLKNAGVLSEGEFELEKAKILNS